MKRLLLFFSILICFLTVDIHADKSIYEWAYVNLDYSLKEKKTKLNEYMTNITQRAKELSKADIMLAFFDILNDYKHLSENSRPPQNAQDEINKLKKQLQKYYINNYLAFYDILFVNTEGDIFYSIRKEGDFNKNISKDEFSKCRLAETLRSNPKNETFIDYHYYSYSDEPAAFLIEPVVKNGKHLGWFVLQCAINKINSIFSGHELGLTEEVVMVNHDGYMLTESIFIADSTILKIKLDDRNIQPKFREKKGHRIVTDYRGFTAMTSFEVVEFMGAKWLVVAKIDMAQVLSEHFIDHNKYYHEKVSQRLNENELCNTEDEFPETEDKEIINVDIDEFLKADEHQLIQTAGVSTCTALIAAYPGKFGYMAHLSPLDKMYNQSRTDLLGHIIHNIKAYDTYMYQRRYVEFVIVANHLNSYRNILDTLLDNGFLLSQIYVIHNPNAKSVNVMFDYSKNIAYAQWELVNGRYVIEKECEQNNLGKILKQIVEE